MKEKNLRERGELPKEEGDAERKHKAMHEEKFLSRWLRADVRGKEDGRRKLVRRDEEEGGEKRKREEENEENQTERVKRRREGFVFDGGL